MHHICCLADRTTSCQVLKPQMFLHVILREECFRQPVMRPIEVTWSGLWVGVGLLGRVGTISQWTWIFFYTSFSVHTLWTFPYFGTLQILFDLKAPAINISSAVGTTLGKRAIKPLSAINDPTAVIQHKSHPKAWNSNCLHVLTRAETQSSASYAKLLWVRLRQAVVYLLLMWRDQSQAGPIWGFIHRTGYRNKAAGWRKRQSAQTRKLFCFWKMEQRRRTNQT